MGLLGKAAGLGKECSDPDDDNEMADATESDVASFLSSSFPVCWFLPPEGR